MPDLRPPGGAVEQGPRIVVVERSPLARAVIARLLKGSALGPQVFSDARSDAALEMALSASVDLIISDVLAEPVAGPDLAAALKANPSPVKLIVLGESSEAAHLLRALRMGANGAMTRDASPEEFLSAVNLVLGGQRVLSAQLLQMILAGALWRPKQPWQLTQAELEVLEMLGRGLSVAEIAARRGGSQKTIRNHLARIYQKLHLRGRTDAMIYAMKAGVVPREPLVGGERKAPRRHRGPHLPRDPVDPIVGPPQA